MKTARSLIVICLSALLIAVNTGGAQLADPDSSLVEAHPAYTQAQVKTALELVLPLVEDITGRKLRRVPPIELVTRSQYVAETTRLRPARRDQRKKAGPEIRERTYVDYAFGAYEPSNSTIYLFPGNFKPRLERAGVPPRYDGVMLEMIVAHELTHALQQQEVWSVPSIKGRGSKGPSPKVVRALTEGHATFVMDEVAIRLGYPDAIFQFHKTVGAGLVAFKDPGHRKENEEYRAQMRSFYLDGERFIRWHYEQGGKERVWRILKDPSLFPIPGTW